MDVGESIDGHAGRADALELQLGVSLAPGERTSVAFLAAVVAHLLFVALFLGLGAIRLAGPAAPNELRPHAVPTPIRVVFYETRHADPAPPPPETRVASDVATRARSEVKPLIVAPTREPAASGKSKETRPQAAAREAPPAGVRDAPRQPAQVPGGALAEALELARRRARTPDDGIAATRTLVSPSLAQGAGEAPVPGPGARFGESAVTSAIQREGFGNAVSGVTETGGLEFDAKDFEWGPYAKKIYAIVNRNWKSVMPLAARMPGVSGKVKVRFRIQKSGKVEALVLLLACGRTALDQAALASITLSDPLPPLPAEFTQDDVGVTFAYYYNLPAGEDE